MLRLQGDDSLVRLVRDGNPRAFDVLVDRYQARLLGFCRQMLGCTEDAEDVLQEVFVNAYRALLADDREIHLRPWLYRIARNRCLNHLRKPAADAQETMDTLPQPEAASTHERVHNREEFRQLLGDVSRLPETQRSALLLREMDAMSYEDIARAMDTTVPSIKSLLVRARISLAEASQARLLTCGEVRLELAEAAEGLCKASGPVRRHVRGCDDCAQFRSQVRSDAKALAALSPIGPLLLFKGYLASKLGLGGGGAASGGASGAGTAAGGGGLGAGVAASGAGGLGAVGSAIGAKAVAGVVAAAFLTAGAVEVNRQVLNGSSSSNLDPSASSNLLQSDQAPAPAATIRDGVVPEPGSAEEIITTSSQPIPPTSAATSDVEMASTLPEPLPAPPVEEPISSGLDADVGATATHPSDSDSISTSVGPPAEDQVATTVSDPDPAPSPAPSPSEPSMAGNDGGGDSSGVPSEGSDPATGTAPGPSQDAPYTQDSPGPSGVVAPR